jgi:LysM repeat protein
MRRVQLLLVVATVVAMLLVAVPVSAAPAASAGGSGCGQFYTVRYGDTLYRIAVRFGTSTWALARLNGITNPDRIWAGQTLCVKAAPQQPWGFLYTVQRGDTLRAIGQRYGWGVWYLAGVNHIANPDYIRVGQVLLIPYH